MQKFNMYLSPKLLFKKRLGFLQEPRVIVYQGFGNCHEVHIKGRILEAKALAKPRRYFTKWHNLKEMAQRYFSGYFPNAKVLVQCAGKQQEVETKADGLFETVFQFEDSLPEGWMPVNAKLVEMPHIRAAGEVLIADADEGLAIISDVDDTVLISHSTEALKALRLLLFRNAKSRMPFEGVAAFYRALCKGTNHVNNPIFYVSSSEWNLYDLLLDFFNHNNIPKGPFLLHDYRTSLFNIQGRGHERHNHKLNKIETLLNTYPGKRFVLIGDSGQRDAEIYREIIERHPSRVKAVFIRNVSSPLRAGAIKKLFASTNRSDTAMYLVDDSLEAAKAAQALGLIEPLQLGLVAAAMRRDLEAPTTLMEGLMQAGK